MFCYLILSNFVLFLGVGFEKVLLFFWLNIFLVKYCICNNIISMISRNNYNVNVIMLKDNIIYLYN